MLERALALCDGQKISSDDLFMGEELKVKIVEKNSYEPGHHLEIGLPEYLEDIEKNAILKALAKANNNKTAAAKLLGVSFRTLRYRLAKLGLAKDEDTDAEDDVSES